MYNTFEFKKQQTARLLQPKEQPMQSMHLGEEIHVYLNDVLCNVFKSYRVELLSHDQVVISRSDLQAITKLLSERISREETLRSSADTAKNEYKDEIYGDPFLKKLYLWTYSKRTKSIKRLSALQSRLKKAKNQGTSTND